MARHPWSPRCLPVATAALLAAMLAACDSDEEQPPPTVPEPDAGTPGCEPGQLELDDGGCLAAGWQENGCAAGELFDGSECRLPGVPPEACAPGFAPDGEQGCVAILPPDPCPAGEMASLGETACRPVAPCEPGTWGSIPTDASTQHVDASYTVGDGDGSAARPWPTIAEGIAAAAAGAIVALAAGSYTEELVLGQKPVRLWGRCPALVEIVGSSSAAAVVHVAAAGAGTELRSLAVRGPGRGIEVADAEDVLLDRVWIHDLGGYGVSALAGSAAELRDSLVEQATERSVYSEGGSIVLDGATVRATRGAGGDGSGRGVNVRDDPAGGSRGQLELSRSVIEDSIGLGVIVHCSDATVDASVVRDTALTAAGRFGRGILVQAETAVCGPSVITVSRSVVERSHNAGIFIAASEATIEHTSVRDTELSLDEPARACGVIVQQDPVTGQAGALELRSSSIARSREAGLNVVSSTALVEGVAVVDSMPGDGDLYGRGMNFQSDPSVAELAAVTVRGSVVEHSYEGGVVADTAHVTLEGCAVRDTQPQLADAEFGRGIVIQTRPHFEYSPSVTIRSTVVEQSHEVGLWLQGVQATVAATIVRDTRSRGVDGWLGLGFEVASTVLGPRGTLALDGSVIEASRAAALVVAGADATVDRTLLRDTRAEDGTGLFGDGITVMRFFDHDALATVTRSRIETSTRAGVACFGAGATLGSLLLDCNRLGLVGETWGGVPPSFQDNGEVRCGCETAHGACMVTSTGLEPPQPPGQSE